MSKALYIANSINHGQSSSNRLAQGILRKLAENEPELQINTRDLSENPLPHLTDAHFAAYLTPPENRTEQQTTDVRISDEALGELKEADIIVIGVPLYNFSIPSTLKAWIDHIVRSGETFRYTERGPEGLLKDKKVYLAIASGGVYSEGPMQSFDFTENYLRAVLGFIGLTDITTFRVEGTKMPGIMETALPNALATVNSYAFAA